MEGEEQAAGGSRFLLSPAGWPRAVRTAEWMAGRMAAPMALQVKFQWPQQIFPLPLGGALDCIDGEPVAIETALLLEEFLIATILVPA